MGRMTESLGEYTEDTEDAASEKDRIVYRIEESMVGSSFQAVCPELLITAFGDSPQQARNGLRQQVAEYLEDCDNLGALDEALIEAGFYFDGEIWMSSEVKPVEGPDIVIL
jgi:hypothetical protein